MQGGAGWMDGLCAFSLPPVPLPAYAPGGASGGDAAASHSAVLSPPGYICSPTAPTPRQAATAAAHCCLEPARAAAEAPPPPPPAPAAELKLAYCTLQPAAARPQAAAASCKSRGASLEACMLTYSHQP